MERMIIHDNVDLEVIATYHDDNTNKDYVIYTNNKLDENKNITLDYSLYENIDDKSIKLIPIVNNEDKQIALNIIKSLIEDMK